MNEFPEVVICKCGKYAKLTEALSAGWLVGWAGDGSGRLVMRCPDHQTAHARRLAGLPGRVSLRRVGKMIDFGLSFDAGEVRWYAERWVHEDRELFVLQRLSGTGIPQCETREFAGLPALVLAMSQVADLRRWFCTGTRRRLIDLPSGAA